MAFGPTTATLIGPPDPAARRRHTLLSPTAAMPAPPSGSAFAPFLSKMTPWIAACFASSRCGAESTIDIGNLRRSSFAAAAVSWNSPSSMCPRMPRPAARSMSASDTSFAAYALGSWPPKAPPQFRSVPALSAAAVACTGVYLRAMGRQREAVKERSRSKAVEGSGKDSVVARGAAALPDAVGVVPMVVARHHPDRTAVCDDGHLNHNPS